jgi:hypothetical protein
MWGCHGDYCDGFEPRDGPYQITAEVQFPVFPLALSESRFSFHSSIELYRVGFYMYFSLDLPPPCADFVVLLTIRS